jgi:hypothetical protein
MNEKRVIWSLSKFKAFPDMLGAVTLVAMVGLPQAKCCVSLPDALFGFSPDSASRIQAVFRLWALITAPASGSST